MNKSQLISDIILHISAGKPSDDLELEPKQVAFWIDQVLNATVKTTLDEKIRSGEGVDGVYLYDQYNVDVLTENNNGIDIFFIELNKEPMNLFRDGGIVRVANSDTFGLVDRVSQRELDTISQLKMSKPSLKNLKYVRRKSRLYLYGLDINTYAANNFDIVYIPLTKVLEELKPTDKIFIAEDLIPIIAGAVKELAKDQLRGIDDIDNDAVETSQQPQKQ